jgi:phosphoribosylanthranilate isomerase
MTTLVKICGLSAPETMNAALEAGAAFVGLVFFAKSPRNVTLKQAKTLAAQARGRAKIVTLVVDADDALLDAIAGDVAPDLFQAHGKETPERMIDIRKRTGIPAYKVVRVATLEHVKAASAFTSSPFILFDAMPPEGAVLPGGNGLAFDWTILKDAPRPFMLAGGLTPDNVGEAIRVTQADMVDVSSGVESSPGVKDAKLIAKFIEAAKVVHEQSFAPQLLPHRPR